LKKSLQIDNRFLAGDLIARKLKVFRYSGCEYLLVVLQFSKAFVFTCVWL